MATEHQLERLSDAYSVLVRLGPIGRVHVHALNVLLDRAIEAGMSFDEPDHEEWSAKTIADWLLSGPKPVLLARWDA